MRRKAIVLNYETFFSYFEVDAGYVSEGESG
jgi:hypothetical protein